ncbi:hypothetical protein Tco_0335567 [Tanacetum coccineum]
MEVLIKTCLMPLAIKTQNDSFTFVHELKQEMHADLKYVESLENKIDELESDKAEFSNMYDILLQECVSNNVMCSYLHSLSDLDAHNELQCLYLHKVKECECLVQKLSKQTASLGKEKASNVFLKEREQYFKIQDLKAQLQDKNIAISMCKIDTRTTQTRAPQLPQTSRNTNPRVSTSTRVIHNTNVSIPQLRSTQMKDKVVPNNSQVKDKKTEVEYHPRISSISNKTKFVTTCNDSLKSRTSNVNDVCATCGKCVINLNHDTCVSKFLNDVNTRTKKPKVVPISTRKPKSQAKKSVATPPKEKIVILFIVDSGCTKHMTGNLTLLCNFIEKYMGTVCFGNDQFAPILGYRDLVQGNITINSFYYVEGLNHNLFSVGQFYDADLEVAFQKSTCFVRDLQGNDLLTGNRGSDLYTISIQEMTSSTPIYLMAKALPTQAWLWHRGTSYLNFEFFNGFNIILRIGLRMMSRLSLKNDMPLRDNNTTYYDNSIRRTGIQQTYTAYLSSDTCMTRSSTKELLSPFENPEQRFRPKRKLFDTPSLVESNSLEFDQNFDIQEQSEEGEIRDNTFSGSEHEDANEHIKKVIEIVDLFYIPKKWHNGTSTRTRSIETSDGLAAIQAQLNNLGREIKKVNEKVYAAQFGAPYQPGGQYRAAGPGFYQRNNRNSLYPDRRPSLKESLTKFMAESAKWLEENSNIIKEI